MSWIDCERRVAVTMISSSTPSCAYAPAALAAMTTAAAIVWILIATEPPALLVCGMAIVTVPLFSTSSTNEYLNDRLLHQHRDRAAPIAPRDLRCRAAPPPQPVQSGGIREHAGSRRGDRGSSAAARCPGAMHRLPS